MKLAFSSLWSLMYEERGIDDATWRGRLDLGIQQKTGEKEIECICKM